MTSLKIGSIVLTGLGLASTLLNSWIEEREREEMKQEIKAEVMDELQNEDKEEES